MGMLAKIHLSAVISLFDMSLSFYELLPNQEGLSRVCGKVRNVMSCYLLDPMSWKFGINSLGTQSKYVTRVVFEEVCR